LTETQPEAAFAAVCATADVPEDAVIAFRANDRDFLLCNAGGELFAIADRCTHAAWQLAGSELREREIVCALHGARFDLHTGEATAHPATKPLRTFPVRIRDGWVEVKLTPPPR
jgi:3-phenylpropionate/trans-cinnamate dioxygenase ferredoxin subunit